MYRDGSLKPWVGKVGWFNLVEMVHAVWFNMILEDSRLGWSGVVYYILLKWSVRFGSVCQTTSRLHEVRESERKVHRVADALWSLSGSSPA